MSDTIAPQISINGHWCQTRRIDDGWELTTAAYPEVVFTLKDSGLFHWTGMMNARASKGTTP